MNTSQPPDEKKNTSQPPKKKNIPVKQTPYFRMSMYQDRFVKTKILLAELSPKI